MFFADDGCMGDWVEVQDNSRLLIRNEVISFSIIRFEKVLVGDKCKKNKGEINTGTLPLMKPKATKMRSRLAQQPNHHSKTATKTPITFNSSNSPSCSIISSYCVSVERG